jgi:hypothetical protein
MHNSNVTPTLGRLIVASSAALSVEVIQQQHEQGVDSTTSVQPTSVRNRL